MTWPGVSINVVVAGGEMNAFFQAGNLSFRGSISVDKRVRTFTNSQPMVRNTVRGGPMKINRRTLLSLLGVAPTALISSTAGSEQLKNKKKIAEAAGPTKIETLNPRGIPPAITLVPLAPRLASIEGKTIYLVSDGFPGADTFLNQISIWFKKNMPSVATVFRLKAGGFADDDPKLWAEIKDKGNAVIMAIGH